MEIVRRAIVVSMVLFALTICTTGAIKHAWAGEGRPGPAVGNSESILWFFIGINGALIALALVIRKNSASGPPVREAFIASMSFQIGSSRSRLAEILVWLTEQARDGSLKMNLCIQLYNAIDEVSAYALKGAQASGIQEDLRANVIIRKGIGSVNLTHAGSALSLAEYDPDNLLKDRDQELDGLELFVAKLQVDFLEYRANLTKDRHLFTIRKSLR